MNFNDVKSTCLGFLWSNGLFTEDIYNLSTGTYSVTVSDALGQNTSVTFNVSEPAALSTAYYAISTSYPGANDGAIYTSNTGGVTPYTYYWTPYATTQHLVNIARRTVTKYRIEAGFGSTRARKNL